MQDLDEIYYNEDDDKVPKWLIALISISIVGAIYLIFKAL